MKIATLARHVRDVCKVNSIGIKKLRHLPGDPKCLQGYSNDVERWVEIPKVKSRISYAIAMHEIGHILGPWQRGATLEKEAGAWKWARENVLVWGKSMESTMHKGMLSYLELAVEESKNLFKKPTKIPERDHYFWQCVPETVKGPSWLNDKLCFVPWHDVLRHPERPRCATCARWEPLAAESQGGLCRHPELRLGRLTPQEAFCENYQCKKK